MDERFPKLHGRIDVGRDVGSLISLVTLFKIFFVHLFSINFHFYFIEVIKLYACRRSWRQRRVRVHARQQ